MYPSLSYSYNILNTHQHFIEKREVEPSEAVQQRLIWAADWKLRKLPKTQSRVTGLQFRILDPSGLVIGTLSGGRGDGGRGP